MPSSKTPTDPHLPASPLSPPTNYKANASSPRAKPSPPPVRETCFFWYHNNTCARRACAFAHETRPTWPINPPPRYVHWTPCHLPLCPVSEEMNKMKGFAGGERYRIGMESAALTRAGTAWAREDGMSGMKERRMRSSEWDGASGMDSYRGLDSMKGTSNRPATLPIRGAAPTQDLGYGPPTGPRRELPLRPPMGPGKKREICFWYYHYKTCHRQTSHTACPRLHSEPQGADVVETPANAKKVRNLGKLPLAVRHRECPMRLCPLRGKIGEGASQREPGLKGGNGGKGVKVSNPKISFENFCQRNLRMGNEEVLRKYKGMVAASGDAESSSRDHGTGGTNTANKLTKKRAREDDRPLLSLRGRREGSDGTLAPLSTTGEGEEDGEDEDTEKWWLDGFPEFGDSEPPAKKAKIDETEVRMIEKDPLLPEGIERAEWDTDYLRRAFGEIP